MDLTPGSLNSLRANGECMAWKVELNSKVLFSKGKMGTSRDTNLRASGLGVFKVLNDKSLLNESARVLRNILYGMGEVCS